MRKSTAIFITILVFVLFSFINCSGDKTTNPDKNGSDPTVSITSPSDGESFADGTNIAFAGSGQDYQGNALPDNMLVWTLDHNSTIGTGTSFDNDTLSVGNHVITLTGTDGEGRTDSENIDISIMELPPGFVLIPAGTFTMGSPESEPKRKTDETQHEVTLTHDFYMAETEVTNKQYADMAQWAYDNDYCTATTVSVKDALDGSTVELLNLDDPDCEIFFASGTFGVVSGKENHPVIDVSWYGSVSYCDWMSMHEGFSRAYDHSTWKCNGDDPYNAEGYRLPTEAEWEYACRAGTQTPFYTGVCLDAGTEADYNGDHPFDGCSNGPNVAWTVQVRSYPANSLGLYDMHGNVWDRCNDWYGSYNGDETDPVGPDTGNYRIVRGGNWAAYAESCRSAMRNWTTSRGASSYYGFRGCRSVAAQ